MFTPEESAFLKYWEENRDRQKKIFRQLLVGIPIGLLFVIPIAINLFSGWDKRADMEANSQRFNPLVLLIALLCIVCFTAVFYRQHKWDQYEQRYLELKARRRNEATEGNAIIEDKKAREEKETGKKNDDEKDREIAETGKK